MVIFDLKAGATEVGQAVACPACAGFFCLACVLFNIRSGRTRTYSG
jgi:hypothetical protein